MRGPKGLAEGTQNGTAYGPSPLPCHSSGPGPLLLSSQHGRDRISAHSMAEIASAVKSAWEGQQRFSLWDQNLKPAGERPSTTRHRQPPQPGLLPLASTPGGPPASPLLCICSHCALSGAFLSAFTGLSAPCLTSVLAGIKV